MSSELLRFGRDGTAQTYELPRTNVKGAFAFAGVN